MFIYSIRQLLKSNVHLGHYKWNSDYRLTYFFLGLRNSIYIINLYHSLYILKCLIYNIYNLGLLNQRILIVNNVNFKILRISDNFEKNRIWYLSKKWIGGLLTNQRNLYIYNEKLFLKFYNVGYGSLLPSLAFIANIEKSSSSIFEAIILNIANASLFDTNLGFYGIFYKLCSNDDSYSVMMLFSRILLKTYIKSIYDKVKVLIKKSIKKQRKKKDNKNMFKAAQRKKKKTFELNNKSKKTVMKLSENLDSLVPFLRDPSNKFWTPLINLPEYIWRPRWWWEKHGHKYCRKGSRMFIRDEYKIKEKNKNYKENKDVKFKFF